MLSMCVRSINSKIWKLKFIVFCDCVMVLAETEYLLLLDAWKQS